MIQPFNYSYVKRKEFKPGQKVVIINQRSKYFNKVGIVLRKSATYNYWILVDGVEGVIQYAFLRPLD